MVAFDRLWAKRPTNSGGLFVAERRRLFRKEV